jgi:hypothetical protein
VCGGLNFGRMIARLRDEDILTRIKEKKMNMNYFRTLTDGINVVFRNIMGAHSEENWGDDQIATSCLILTFYLVNLYVWSVRKTEFQ